MYNRIWNVLICISMLLSFTACSNKNPYTILEIGGYDCISDTNHNDEFQLQSQKTVNSKLNKEKKIKYGSEEYEVNYEYTETGYLYNKEVEKYSKRYGQDTTKKLVDFWINTKTGRMDYYYWFDANYLQSPDLTEKSREECLTISREYLASYVDDVEAYELVDEIYRKDPDLGGQYDFVFARMIDGVMTADLARIRVTIHGIVYNHGFQCLGEMKGAKLPDKEIIDSIYSDMDKRLANIYDPAKEKYNVTIEHDKTVFERLWDGRYALEIYYEAKLTSLENEDAIPKYEMSRFIVILEDD